MMKIVLSTSIHLDHGWRSVEQYPASRLHMQDFVPMGLLCLKAMIDATDLGVETKIVEVNSLINAGRIPDSDDFFVRLGECMLESGDDLVGLMTDADSLHHTICLAEQIKRLSPRTQICLGGPTASPLARKLLECNDCIDMVVRGEGELTLAELVTRLSRGRKPDGVLGVTWRDGESIVDNPGRHPVDDLDTLPVPAFEAFDMAAGAPLYMDVGRGCPFACRFCSTAPFWQRNFRMKSIDRIVHEMNIVRDRYGRQHVNFSHDLFTANRGWVERFCARLVEERLGVTWTCSSRTDVIDEALLERMAEAGCVEIYYGIETGAPELQRIIDKNLDLDRARAIVLATRMAGIRPVTGFIVGYPMETVETFSQTLSRFFAFLEAGDFRAHLFTLCPFPEAPLYREYAHTLDRSAEYYDLPLTPAAAHRSEALRLGNPELFSSTFRYATPLLRSSLVDASEELAPHLVTLKALWPLLLRCYPSEFDWYERWTAWIEAVNRDRGRVKTLHQGTAEDLLDFAQSELDRLELTESDIAEFVRYERMKIAAQRLERCALPVERELGSLDDDTVVAKGCDFLIESTRYDLRKLLRGERTLPMTHGEPRWMVVLQRADRSIDALQVGPFGHSVLMSVFRPRRVGELLAGCERLGGTSDGDARSLIGQLIARGLLAVEAN